MIHRGKCPVCGHRVCDLCDNVCHYCEQKAQGRFDKAKPPEGKSCETCFAGPVRKTNNGPGNQVRICFLCGDFSCWKAANDPGVMQKKDRVAPEGHKCIEVEACAYCGHGFDFHHEETGPCSYGGCGCLEFITPGPVQSEPVRMEWKQTHSHGIDGPYISAALAEAALKAVHKDMLDLDARCKAFKARLAAATAAYEDVRDRSSKRIASLEQERTDDHAEMKFLNEKLAAAEAACDEGSLQRTEYMLKRIASLEQQLAAAVEVRNEWYDTAQKIYKDREAQYARIASLEAQLAAAEERALGRLAETEQYRQRMTAAEQRYRERCDGCNPENAAWERSRDRIASLEQERTDDHAEMKFLNEKLAAAENLRDAMRAECNHAKDAERDAEARLAAAEARRDQLEAHRAFWEPSIKTQADRIAELEAGLGNTNKGYENADTQIFNLQAMLGAEHRRVETLEELAVSDGQNIAHIESELLKATNSKEWYKGQTRKVEALLAHIREQHCQTACGHQYEPESNACQVCLFGPETHAPETPDLTVREACRKRMSLDGTDAEALEHALTQAEKERDELKRAGASQAPIVPRDDPAPLQHTLSEYLAAKMSLAAAKRQPSK